MREIPPLLKDLKERYPRVWSSHEQLSEACLEAGPLDRKTALLVKVGIAASSRKRTPLATHIRRALDEGVTPDEVEHAIILTASTQGLSTMMQALHEWNSIRTSS